jgi:hypothetical protein
MILANRKPGRVAQAVAYLKTHARTRVLATVLGAGTSDTGRHWPASSSSWYSCSDLQRLEMPEDTKLLAKMIFTEIDGLACARPGAVSGLLPALT